MSSIQLNKIIYQLPCIQDAEMVTVVKSTSSTLDSTNPENTLLAGSVPL
jgi:hypothetical protein